MAKYICKGGIRHNRGTFIAGDEIELDDESAERLLRRGSIQRVSAVQREDLEADREEREAERAEREATRLELQAVLEEMKNLREQNADLVKRLEAAEKAKPSETKPSETKTTTRKK